MRQTDRIITIIIILSVIAGIWIIADKNMPKIEYHETKEKACLFYAEKCRTDTRVFNNRRLTGEYQKAADRHKKKKDQAIIALVFGSLGTIIAGAGIFGFVRKRKKNK